jgi:hypothetical protein
MCECLLEKKENVRMPEDDVAYCLEVHTTYKLGCNAVDPLGYIPRAEAQSEMVLTWLTEDEI